jgi:hypothetical protein
LVSNEQLYLIIGIPLFVNAARMGVAAVFIRAKFNELERRFDLLDNRFDELLDRSA